MKLENNYKTLLKENIVENDKKQKYLLNIIMLLGALGFLTAGISSYLQYDIIPFIESQKIIFFPQGIIMCFYGFIGTLLSINQIRILSLKVGEGYNEFDKIKGTIKIFRKGIRGKDSDINLTYQLNEIVRTINIYLITKNKILETYLI
jgi:hypothetical protein